MADNNPIADELRTGQRVSRKDGAERGTVVEADGKVKVKWDSGRTSYYVRGRPGNVAPIETEKQATSVGGLFHPASKRPGKC